MATPAPKIRARARSRWPFWSCAKFEAAIFIPVSTGRCNLGVCWEMDSKKYTQRRTMYYIA
jgi:hypothetical protein